MDDVFGCGGKLKFSSGPKGRGQDKTLQEMQKQLESLQKKQRQPQPPSQRPVTPSASQRPAPNPAQAARQRDEALRDTARQVEELSGELAQGLRADGLIDEDTLRKSAGPLTAQQREEAFAACVKQAAERLPGRQELVGQLCDVFRRAALYGGQGQKAAGVTLISGGLGSGRRTALERLVRALEDKKLLTGGIAWLDLGRYPGPDQEKLFLQDLYAALAGPQQVIALEHYEACHPGFLSLLGGLLAHGEAALTHRYVEQKGVLVDVGTALSPKAIGSLTPRGKYFFFFSEKGLPALAERMGADFIQALGPVCLAQPLTPEQQLQAADQQLEQLVGRAREKLEVRLTVLPAVRELAAGQYSAARGMLPMMEWCEKCFRALLERQLETSLPAGAEAELAAEGGCLMLWVKGQEAQPLLPQEQSADEAALAAVREELEHIVGLDQVKTYILGLADNARVQKRREAAGFKANRLSMHMIFAGSPGTGKTTIARLTSKYLKASGVLRGGQLVEVSRADLVGRYVGHTAPLTRQVIESALGGVLFIDEAYSLYRGRDDSFGLEAIDTLVKGMEDHRDDLVVVLAGYTDEMEHFLQANSGLASRFPNRIEFPDYTAEQLLRILHLQATGKGYRLEEGCDAALLDWFAKKQAENAAQNGNGRMVRNLLEAAVLQQARRVAALPDAVLDELLLADFALEEK